MDPNRTVNSFPVALGIKSGYNVVVFRLVRGVTSVRGFRVLKVGVGLHINHMRLQVPDPCGSFM